LAAGRLAHHFVAREEYWSGEEIGWIARAPTGYCENYRATPVGPDPKRALHQEVGHVAKLELEGVDFGHDWYKMIQVIVKQEVGRAQIHRFHRDRVLVHVDVGKHTFGWVANEAGEIDLRAEGSFDVEVRS
jgi:hypothetical protein